MAHSPAMKDKERATGTQVFALVLFCGALSSAIVQIKAGPDLRNAFGFAYIFSVIHFGARPVLSTFEKFVRSERLAERLNIIYVVAVALIGVAFSAVFRDESLVLSFWSSLISYGLTSEVDRHFFPPGSESS